MIFVNPQNAFLTDENNASLAVVSNGVTVQLAEQARLFFVGDRVGSDADGRYLVYGEERVLAELAV